MTTQQKELAASRRKSNVWMVLLALVCVVLYRYNTEILALVSSRRPEEVGDIGIEALQKGFMAMFFVPWGIAFSALIASMAERQLREDAFGSFSRWGVVFALSLLCFTLVVT